MTSDFTSTVLRTHDLALHRYVARRYATLRIAIADREVGQFITANASTLLQLAQFGDQHRDAIIAVIGNPNTGKSTLFGRLCGLRTRTANFPGSTVEARIGSAGHEGNAALAAALRVSDPALLQKQTCL